jgi:hypothetical protein
MFDPVAMSNAFLSDIMSQFPGMDAMFQQQNHSVPQTVPNNPMEVADFEALLSGAMGNTVAESLTHHGVDFNDAIRLFTDATRTDDPQRQIIMDTIAQAAAQYNLDPTLVKAVMQAESNFRPDVVSSAGAMGLMQLMPGTAAYLGVENPFDIVENIHGGARYLRLMLDLFDEDVELAGPSRVDAAGGIPPFQETQRYVRNVMALYHRYREENS